MSREVIDETPSRDHGMVYAIIHEPSGRRYIGATQTSLSLRMRGHLGPLNKGTHPLGELQDDWNRDGSDAFYVEVIDREIHRVKLRDVEQDWIERYRSEGGVYNRTKTTPPFRFGQSVFSKPVKEMAG